MNDGNMNKKEDSDINNETKGEIDLTGEIYQEAHNKEYRIKIEKLELKLANLKKEHKELSQDLKNEGIQINDIVLSDKILKEKYEKEMKRHIKQLKKYNELKDLSMGIIQLIADQKNSTLREVMNEMGVEEDDK